MAEEVKTVIATPIVKEAVAATVAAPPQAIPAIVESTKTAAPVVLSQAAPMGIADTKPAVVVAPIADKK